MYTRVYPYSTAGVIKVPSWLWRLLLPSLPFSLHFRRSLEELVFFSIAKVRLLAENSYLRFSGGRALETLVKQHAEMSLFVKHFADKQHFPVFLGHYGRRYHAYSLDQGISVANSLGPRDPKRISRAK